MPKKKEKLEEEPEPETEEPETVPEKSPLTVVSPEFKTRRDVGVVRGVRARACRSSTLMKALADDAGVPVEDMNRALCGVAPTDEEEPAGRVIECIEPNGDEKKTYILVPKKSKK